MITGARVALAVVCAALTGELALVRDAAAADPSWTGLDYEIAPDARFGAAYWEAAERGEEVEALKPRGDNPLWRAIRSRLRPSSE